VLERDELRKLVGGALSNEEVCEARKKINSTLINEPKYYDMFYKWFGNRKFRLINLYRMTLHGCRFDTFHEKVDNKGPTVSVMTTAKGQIFGGFISINIDRKAEENERRTDS
jgi:hypothetical protein